MLEQIGQLAIDAHKVKLRAEKWLTRQCEKPGGFATKIEDYPHWNEYRTKEAALHPALDEACKD